MQKPVVSIIGTVFNQVKLAERTLDIWCRQNFDQPYEIIVMDDGSTDGTREMIGAYEKKYPGLIRYFYFDAPDLIRNCTLLFNTAIRRLMRSEIAVIQWYDRIPSTFDALSCLYEPHLEKERIAVSFITRHIGGSSSRDIIDDSTLDRLMAIIPWRDDPKSLARIMGPPGVHCHRETMNESACFSIKKKHFEEINGYDERYYKVANYSNVELYGRVKQVGIEILILDHYTFHQPHAANREDVQTQIEPDDVVIRNINIRENWGAILPDNMVSENKYDLTIVTDKKIETDIDKLPVSVELIVSHDWNEALHRGEGEIMLFVANHDEMLNHHFVRDVLECFWENGAGGCVGMTGGKLTINGASLALTPNGLEVEVINSPVIAVARRSALANGLVFSQTGSRSLDCIDFSLQMKIWGGRKNYGLKPCRPGSYATNYKFVQRWQFLENSKNIRNE
jgi:hypothetical protein